MIIYSLLEVFGRVLEPYIMKTIKILMHYYGDNDERIRDLSVNTTQVLMKCLSGYGVKMILPILLEGLNQDSWRAKQNNIWALGNMAFCSP